MQPKRQETRVLTVGKAGWRLQVHESVVSTNDVARDLPSWFAVMARAQTGGRGRFGRSFSCSPGGLWLSAVVPAPGGTVAWSGFSLAVGLHMLRALRALGVHEVRLRWPNDLMVQNGKLAGLLVEEGSGETLIAGIGLNIHNCPWEDEPTLKNVAVRLDDLLAAAPTPEELASVVLNSIADAHEVFANQGLHPIIEGLNADWSQIPVRLQLHNKPTLHATFLGLDSSGNLRVQKANQTSETIVPHHHVEKFTETQATQQ